MSDKVGKETANKQIRTSTNQEEKKENENTFPTNTIAYCTSHSNRIKQATNRKIKNLQFTSSSRINSSQAKPSIFILASPSFSVDPSFPTESKAGQPVNYLCIH